MDLTTIAVFILDLCLLGVGAVLIPTLLKVSRILEHISSDVGRFGTLLAQIYEILNDTRVANEQLRGQMRGIEREIENLKVHIK